MRRRIAPSCVKENIRTVIGQHLVYTPANQTYVMTGAPVEIEEKKTANECSVSYATEVTFRRDAEATIMKNNLVAPVKLRQCGPVGPGFRLAP